MVELVADFIPSSYRYCANGVPARYEQLEQRGAALREELHTEIERILNDVVKFKLHIQKSLEDYEGFVAEEVEKEWEELEHEGEEEKDENAVNGEIEDPEEMMD